jgi:hypothetical protein
MGAHPLKGKWLIHYYSDKLWQSACDLPEEEALAICERTGKRYLHCPETGKSLYYQARLHIEERDRTEHIARGGRVECQNPVYTILSDKPQPGVDYHRGDYIAISAESVPADLISLSLGDSFTTFDPFYDCGARGTILGQSYSPQTFQEVWSDRPLSGDWPVAIDSSGTPFYIEARLYTRDLPQAVPVAARPVVTAALPAVCPS